MKLRYSPTSPYVRKVSVTAVETGLADQIERVQTDPWAAETDLGASNPLGKVPALITDEGDVLFDSPVICEYLDSRSDTAALFPKEGAARWRVLRLQALGDGILDAAVLRLLEGRRPDELQSVAWADRQKAAIDRALNQLEREADGLDGPVTIGQIAVGCGLGYLDFRFPGDDWRAGRPRLAAWYEGFAQRESMQATIPKDPQS
ncbi:MAG: glutathione S-transferase N-terminal domain-containing protein [Alphaproteobacteria bacterium]|nr:glutathione S-transferase N-terminal domain-containing protein [Alphaproteobacteria bacterium]